MVTGPISTGGWVNTAPRSTSSAWARMHVGTANWVYRMPSATSAALNVAARMGVRLQQQLDVEMVVADGQPAVVAGRHVVAR
ncbi:MAG: hypothetical protein U0R72_12885 [Nakamurella multipartita]